MLPPAAAGPWVESRRRGPCLQIAAQLAAMRADGGGAPSAAATSQYRKNRSRSTNARRVRVPADPALAAFSSILSQCPSWMERCRIKTCHDPSVGANVAERDKTANGSASQPRDVHQMFIAFSKMDPRRKNAKPQARGPKRVKPPRPPKTPALRNSRDRES
jgi:hypothetical protein